MLGKMFAGIAKLSLVAVVTITLVTVGLTFWDAFFNALPGVQQWEVFLPVVLR